MSRNGTDSRITPPGVPIAISERAERKKRESGGGWKRAADVGTAVRVWGSIAVALIGGLVVVVMLVTGKADSEDLKGKASVQSVEKLEQRIERRLDRIDRRLGRLMSHHGLERGSR